VIGRSTQGQRPDGGAEAVEQQVAARRIARQANGHRHHRAQAIDEAKTQHPDVGVAADVVQRPITHGLPARLACQDLAPMATAHEVPQLVASIAAQEGHQAHQLDVHVAAEREKTRKHQDGLAFKEGA